MPQTIRRTRTRETAADPQRRWLPFLPGQYGDRLVVDPARCPLNLHARGHWQDDPDGKPVRFDLWGTDVVLGRCLCETGDGRG